MDGVLYPIFWFSLYAYSPQLSSYAREQGASFRMIGLISGAYGLSQTLLRIPLGIIADRRKKQKLFLFLGSVFSLASALVFLLGSTVLAIFLARLLAGVAAASWVNSSVLYAGYYTPEEAPKALGILSGISRSGMFLGMLLGSLFGGLFGIRSIFLLCAFGALFTLIILTFIPEEYPKDSSFLPQGSHDRSFLGRPFFYFYTLLAMISQFITYGTTFTFTPLLARDLGATFWQIGLMNMGFILPQIFVSPFVGSLFLGKLGEKKCLLFGFFLSFLVSSLTPKASSLSLLFALQGLAGFGSSFSLPLLSGLVLREASPGERSRLTGVFQSVYGLGMLLGPTLMGTLASSRGLDSGFLATRILSLLGILMILAARL